MRRWLPTIWLGFVVVRYGSTTLKTLRTPFSPGLDIEWAAAWMGFNLLVALSALLLRRTLVNRVWLALILAAALAGLILSRTLPAALMAAGILIIAGGLGEFVLQKFRVAPTGMLERIAVTTPIGIGLLALGQLALGLTGFFNTTASVLLLALLAIPAVSGVREICRQPLENGIGAEPLVVVPLGGIFLLNLMWAMAPEVQYDALNVHLAVPRTYLEQGSIVDLPYFFHSYFVHLIDMVFGLGLAVGGALAPKFIVLGLGVVALAGVFALGRTLFNDEVGVWSALIFYSTPLIVWLSATTYVDLAEICFIVAAILAFIRWWESSATGWLVASGWIAGVAIGVKLHALTILGVLPFALAWRAWKQARVSVVRTVLIYGLALAVVAAPWYAVIYAFTGNPIYPFLNAAFRSPQWQFENTRLDAGNFGIGASPSSLVRLPFWLTWDTKRFGEGLPQGGVGLALLLAFPLALVFLLPKRARQSWPPSRIDIVRILLACIGLHLTLWAFSFQYGRYYIPVMPLAAVVGIGVLLAPKANASWNRCLLFVGVLAQAPIAAVMFWNIDDRFPIQNALGRESAESILSRGLAGYDGAKYINTVIRPGEKVLAVGAENLRFYLNAPLYTLAETSRGHELLKLVDIKPDPELAAALVRFGFAYILTPPADLKKPEPYYTYLQPAFVERFGKQVYRDENVVVLKLCATGC